MIKELDKDQVDAIKANDVSILLIYAEGCAACEAVKPEYKSLPKTFKKLSFFQGDINKVIDFYLNYAEKVPAVDIVTDEKGNPIQDNKGNYETKLVRDEKGNTVLKPNIVIPTFYVFVKQEAGPDNPYGFVGGIDGADINTLKQTLEVLNQYV